MPFAATAVLALAASFRAKRWMGYRAWRLLHYASFGAFVGLQHDIDGLVHISKLGGGKRRLIERL